MSDEQPMTPEEQWQRARGRAEQRTQEAILAGRIWVCRSCGVHLWAAMIARPESGLCDQCVA
jgi:hypothetical protein